MTIDEIRKKAPVGATHYYQFKSGNVIYFKQFMDSGNLYRMTPNWTATRYTIEKIKPL